MNDGRLMRAEEAEFYRVQYLDGSNLPPQTMLIANAANRTQTIDDVLRFFRGWMNHDPELYIVKVELLGAESGGYGFVVVKEPTDE